MIDMPELPGTFWQRVEKTDTCWLWMGTRISKGYGTIGIGGRILYVHRLAYANLVAPLEEGQQIDHACHVPACVNPDHLSAVSNQQNGENRAGAYRNSGSGVRGVSWHRRAGKWVVQVTSHNVPYYGGLFAELEEAERAAIALRNSLMTNNLLDRRTA